jgi:SAM-dependent methyltransferase
MTMLFAATNGTVVTIVVFVILAVVVVGFLGIYLTREKKPSPASDAQGKEELGETLAKEAVPRSPEGVAMQPEGVVALRSEQELRDKYKELRERPGLVRVQAIWAAVYADIDIADYFQEEREFLSENPKVQFERIVIGQDHHMTYLQELTTDHQNLRIFTSPTNLQFELYLCEYAQPVRHMVGVLVVNSALSRLPEFGVLLDGDVDRGLTQFGYTLRNWFESIPKTAVAGTKRTQNVWTRNAREYDEFVHRESELPFLRDFIRQEETLLEDLLTKATQDVTLLEFGSGTGRTLIDFAKRGNLGKVKLFLGLDHSQGMLEVARRKRDKTARNARDRLFFFDLDGAHANRAFWNGQVRLHSSMNDEAQLKRAGFEAGGYERGDRFICCLLNTLGVLDATTREAMLRNMFTAAGDDDSVIISVFDREAFEVYARELYPHIHALVGKDEITDESYDDQLAEFRAGYYYSHWFAKEEIESLVDQSGGKISHEWPIKSGDATIGLFVLAKRDDV